MESSAQEIIEGLVAVVSTWGLRVIGALAVLVVGRIVAVSIRRMSRRGMQRANIDPSLVPFLSNLLYYLLLAVVVIAVLNLFGIETTSLIAIVGAAGLAIGLAMQGALSNVAAGVMLLIFRPFKVGDFVAVGGSSGSVDEIGLFTTTLHTGDNVRIIVPNSSVYGETIRNFSANDTRRNDIVMGIGYGDDVGSAIEVISRVLAADARVLDQPPPLVAVGELADSSVNLLVRPWCKKEDYWQLRCDLLRTLKEELEAVGCTIPFPQRDVHLINESST